MVFGTAALATPAIVLAWIPREWLWKMDWYRSMMGAGWFSPLRPYWEKYYLDCVVLALLLLVLILMIRSVLRHVRLSRRLEPGSRRARNLSLKTAEHYLENGEPMLAAQAFIDAGEPERALPLLAGNEAWAQAAILAESMGQLRQAAEFCERARDLAGAIRILVQMGEVDEAADLYRKQDRLVDAASVYLDAGEPVKAAWIFREAGLFRKAAALFFEADKDLLAAEALAVFIMENKSGFTEEEAELLRRGAAAFYQSGRIRDSASMRRAVGDLEDAAAQFVEIDDQDAAADCCEAMGNLERAAQLVKDPRRKLVLLERMRREGALVEDRQIAEAMRDAGEHDRAAAAFEELGDLDGAVRANMDSGNLADAAAILVGEGMHGEAARVFEEGGDLLAAREQFLLAGDRLAAARTARLAQNYFEAGREYFEMGDLEQAVDCLQLVEAKHERFRSASTMLGQAFTSLGDPTMARRMHERACQDLSLNRDNLQHFYRWARFLESSGDEASLVQAKGIYGRILEVQYAYLDVKNRYDQIPAAS